MSTTRKTIHFEKSLDQLEQLIQKMETGQLSLESSLHCFEEGISLIKQCQKALTEAEQKIQILTEKPSKKPKDLSDHDDE